MGEFVAFGVGQVVGDLGGYVVGLPACWRHVFGDVGDAVAEGVSGVVVGERALLGGALQDEVGVVVVVVEGGEFGGEGG